MPDLVARIRLALAAGSAEQGLEIALAPALGPARRLAPTTGNCPRGKPALAVQAADEVLGRGMADR